MVSGLIEDVNVAYTGDNRAVRAKRAAVEALFLKRSNRRRSHRLARGEEEDCFNAAEREAPPSRRQDS